MRKTYKFRVYPNEKQKKNISKALSQACYVYNQLIEKQKNYYDEEQKKHSRYDMNFITKEIKTPNLYSLVKQNISTRIDESYKLFFSNIKKKIKASPPKFRKRMFYRSLTYPQSGFKLEDNKIKLSRLGNIDIKQHREVEGQIKTVTIKQLPNEHYYVFFSCDEVSPKLIETELEETVGIDVGIKEFAVLSNGFIITYPKFLKKSKKKLSQLQRKHSRKKKGSKNRDKSRIKVAKIHHKIVCQRRDFFFKVANVISNNFKHVGVENLQIKNMLKNHKLAHSISDVAWNEFMLILDFKLKEKGGEMIKVNARNTTSDCSNCNNRQKMSLDKRVYNCSNCGLRLDRDYNASINIENRMKKQLNYSAVGHTVKVFGDNVRPSFTFVNEANINELETSYIKC